MIFKGQISIDDNNCDFYFCQNENSIENALLDKIERKIMN